jgi:hypothetical protein
VTTSLATIDIDIATATAAARHEAVAELFAALQTLMVDYQSPSEAGQVQSWNEDAERITGEVARHLCAARTRISQRPTPGVATRFPQD